MESTTTLTPLQEMHKATDLTLTEGADRYALALGRPSFTHSAYLYLLNNGTRDEDKIKALAVVFGRPIHEVTVAALTPLNKINRRPVKKT